ncbi:MAG: hypothetical protein Q9188_005454 [Gyalolechia gomerana]
MPLHQDLTIGWAARVSLPQLCARLIAYGDTQPSITAFRLAIQHAPSSALRSLPEEVTLMIANNVRDIAYQRNIEQWIQIAKCLTNTCTDLSHARCDGLDWCEGNVYDRHRKILAYWTKWLTELNGKSGIAKYVEIFAQNTSIQPYLMVEKSYHGYSLCHPGYDVDAKAYLVLPVVRAPIISTPGYDVASLAINSTIDLSTSTHLTEDQHKSFRTAAAMLRLHPYNAEEDKALEKLHDDGKIYRDSHGGKDTEALEDGREDEDHGSEDQSAADDADKNGTKEEPIKSGDARKVSRQTHEFKPQLMILACGDLKTGGFDY